MAANGKSNNTDKEVNLEPILRIDPPAKIKNGLREPIKLILEFIYLAVVFLPLLLWSIIEKFFFSNPKSITGKVILVTGSGRGLGAGFAEKFIQLGCKVACVDIDENLNQEMVKRLNDIYPESAKAYKCNVAFSNEIKALKEAVYKDFGRVDILVHNAGLLAALPITDAEDIYIHGVIGVNLTSHFFMIREFLPDMIKRNEGHVVAIASIAAFTATSNASMYVATKHGVLGLMNSLHYELQEIPNNQVKTTTVCPYFVNTSAFYTKQWELRIPELSIKKAVCAAVDGILRNRRIVTIPNSIYIYLALEKLLPDRIIDIIRSIFYVRINTPPINVQQSTPMYRLLTESREKFENMIRGDSDDRKK